MPKATFTGNPHSGYRGAIKIGKKVVWHCAHVHANRDHSSLTNGQSAKSCAQLCIDVATNPTLPLRLRSYYAGASNMGRYAVLNWRGLNELTYAESVADEIRRALGTEG